MVVILIAPKWRERTLNGRTFVLLFPVSRSSTGYFNYDSSASGVTSHGRNNGSASLSYVRRKFGGLDQTLSTGGIVCLRATGAQFLYLKKKEEQGRKRKRSPAVVTMHTVERVKLRALCRNHQHREHPLLRRARGE